MKRLAPIAACLSLLAGAALADMPSPLNPLGIAQTWTPARLQPVAWYKGDGNALDSASTNNVTWAGTETYTNGVNGQAFAFDGSSYTQDGRFGLSSNSTVCFWVKPAAMSVLSAISQRGNSARDFLIRTPNDSSGVVRFLRWTGSGADLNYWTTTGVVSTASWSHIAIVCNGTNVSMAINGAVEYPAMTKTSGEHPQESFSIGRFGTLFFRGGIDDVLIFTTALTPSETAQIYNWRQ